MDFGVREVCNVVLKAIDAIPANKSITGKAIAKGEPVMYFDTLKVSTMTGAVSTVYATGGQGNPRLLAWDSDKEITFNMEDALISPESFALLAGGVSENNEDSYIGTGTLTAGSVDLSAAGTPVLPAGTIADTDVVSVKAVVTAVGTGTNSVGDILPATFVGATSVVTVTGGTDETVEITIVYRDSSKFIKVHKKEILTVSGSGATASELIYKDADFPVFAFKVDDHGNIQGGAITITTTSGSDAITGISIGDGERFLIDYYTEQYSANTITVEANRFAGFYKLEADTLWRRESDGQDVTAQFVIPKLKIKSNFELTMEATGDPSTFSFEADAFKVDENGKSVMFKLDILDEDINA